MWESRRDFQRVWEVWEAGFVAFHTSHTLSFPWPASRPARRPGGGPENGITEQMYYRWRKEYCALQVDQARRLKELESENAKLKRLVSELSLEKLVLKDIASGNF